MKEEIAEYMGRRENWNAEAKAIWVKAYDEAIRRGKSRKEARVEAEEAVRRAGYYLEDGDWYKGKKRRGVA